LTPDEALSGHLTHADQLLQGSLGHRANLGAPDHREPARRRGSGDPGHHRDGDDRTAGRTFDAESGGRRPLEPEWLSAPVTEEGQGGGGLGAPIVPALSVDLGGTGDLHRRLPCPLGKVSRCRRRTWAPSMFASSAPPSFTI